MDNISPGEWRSQRSPDRGDCKYLVYYLTLGRLSSVTRKNFIRLSERESHMWEHRLVVSTDDNA